MIKRYKYDVAISVAEEDKNVAKQIVAELKKKNICYYYYEENAAESWGEYIINLTADSYGGKVRFILMITSEHFVKKYWSGIERQIALSNKRSWYNHILQLRLDDTSVDGILSHINHQNWCNNPEYIATLLSKKVRQQKRAQLPALLAYVLGLLILIAIVAFKFIKRDHVADCLTASAAPSFQKVLIIPDSFYISNTEVTIEQYRIYCDSMQKPFPAQPLHYHENGPVVNVTWDEAQQFCQWKGGRLPTKAEWEYAAGAGVSSSYAGGNNAQLVAVYHHAKPCNVGTKRANSFGLYDMSGNAAEWCTDWTDSTHTYKLVKGGAYNNNVDEITIGYSAKEIPTTRRPDIGFRVAWDK